MKNYELIKFYKQEIKLLTPKIRGLKHDWKAMQRNPNADWKASWKVLGDLLQSQKRARLFNTAYAIIRDKDASKVEPNPRKALDPKDIESFIVKIEAEFSAQQKTPSTVEEKV